MLLVGTSGLAASRGRTVSGVPWMTAAWPINSNPCSLPKPSGTGRVTSTAPWTIPNSVRSVSPYRRYLSAKGKLSPCGARSMSLKRHTYSCSSRNWRYSSRQPFLQSFHISRRSLSWTAGLPPTNYSPCLKTTAPTSSPGPKATRRSSFLENPVGGGRRSRKLVIWSCP